MDGVQTNLQNSPRSVKPSDFAVFQDPNSDSFIPYTGNQYSIGFLEDRRKKEKSNQAVKLFTKLSKSLKKEVVMAIDYKVGQEAASSPQ